MQCHLVMAESQVLAESMCSSNMKSRNNELLLTDDSCPEHRFNNVTHNSQPINTSLCEH